MDLAPFPPSRDCMDSLRLLSSDLRLCCCPLLSSTNRSSSPYCSPSGICLQWEAFLIGPVQQARMMLDPVRVYATIIYVGSIVVALVCVLWIHSEVLTVIVIVSEICALVWCLNEILRAKIYH